MNVKYALPVFMLLIMFGIIAVNSAANNPAISTDHLLQCTDDHTHRVMDDKGKLGYWDRLLNQNITNIEYDRAECFNAGLALVGKNDKYGFINKQGKAVIPLVYDDAWEFAENLANVKKDGKWGFIDKTGKTVIPFRYQSVGGFFRGFAPVENDKGWLCIDKKGKEYPIAVCG